MHFLMILWNSNEEWWWLMIRIFSLKAISQVNTSIQMKIEPLCQVQELTMMLVCHHSGVIAEVRQARGVCTAIIERWEAAVLKRLIIPWSKRAITWWYQLTYFKLILLDKSMKEDQLKEILSKLIDQVTLISIANLPQIMKELILHRVISQLWMISKTVLV